MVEQFADTYDFDDLDDAKDFDDLDDVEDPESERQSAPHETQECYRCGRQNDPALIYCINPACIAPLANRFRTCACGHLPPFNVNYCPQCGVRMQPLAS